MAITYAHSSGPKTVLRQVKHRSAKVRHRSRGPKKCHGILPMQGPSHSSVVKAIRMSPSQSSAVVFAANRQ